MTFTWVLRCREWDIHGPRILLKSPSNLTFGLLLHRKLSLNTPPPQVPLQSCSVPVSPLPHSWSLSLKQNENLGFLFLLRSMQQPLVTQSVMWWISWTVHWRRCVIGAICWSHLPEMSSHWPCALCLELFRRITHYWLGTLPWSAAFESWI